MRAVKWIAIAIGILLLIGVVGGIAVIGILGGDTKVSLGKELRSHYRAHVVKMAKLPPGETIEMFYSSDLLLPDYDGNLLTNVAVYSWGDHLGDGRSPSNGRLSRRSPPSTLSRANPGSMTA
jgi:hypothetical protein